MRRAFAVLLFVATVGCRHVDDEVATPIADPMPPDVSDDQLPTAIGVEAACRALPGGGVRLSVSLLAPPGLRLHDLRVDGCAPVEVEDARFACDVPARTDEVV